MPVYIVRKPSDMADCPLRRLPNVLQAWNGSSRAVLVEVRVAYLGDDAYVFLPVIIEVQNLFL